MFNFDISSFDEFDNHHEVKIINDYASGLKGVIALHESYQDYPSFGATRLFNYPSFSDAIRDGLRLSKLMTYKAALAGLPYGGAKGVLIDSNNFKDNKKNLLKTYTQYINGMDGKFITGTDVGMTQYDINYMKKYSPHIVGHLVDPSYFTAVGIVSSMKKINRFINSTTDLSGCKISIQGVGKVGSWIIDLLINSNVNVYISDIDFTKLWPIKKKYPQVTLMDNDLIISQKVDIYSPCALNGSLNIDSIDKLNCKAIVGAANNQLADYSVGDILLQKGVIYAPDYVVNSGGLISVVDEFENDNFNENRIINRIEKANLILNYIIDKSKDINKSPNIISDDMAKEIIESNSI